MITVLTIKQSSEWDAIVKSFDDYDVYYLSGYVKAFQVHGDGEPLLFLFENEHCRGINVVMKRDISFDNRFEGKIEKGKFFDFATPYGYGGWLIEGNDYSALFREYEEWCLKYNIITEFVRFHPVIDNRRYSENYYSVVPLGETVSIDTTDKDAIWANFSPKNRNVIRKAINNGVTIKNGLSRELLATFKNIYNQTMDKDNADKYYYFEDGFYDSVLEDLKENATIFYAELNGVVVAASIMIYANGRLNYHLSGSLRAFQNLAPTNLLIWKAAEWGNDIGCSSFHLGGGVGSEEDGLFRFKRSFYRGELCRYYIGKKVFNEKINDYLCALRRNIEKKSFFPLYRG